MEINCSSLKDTQNFALNLSKCVKNGAFITLRGKIGAGKTTFTRSLLQNLGVTQNVTSPTFVLLNEYRGENNLAIYHFDLYRLEINGIKRIESELLEYSEKNCLTLVEWADYGEKYLPKERLDIEFIYGNIQNNIEERIIKINAIGEQNEKIMTEFMEQKLCKC